MESRGQRGSKKGKLVMTFYRALSKAPPKTAAVAAGGGRKKVKDESTTAGGGVNIIIKQDQVLPPSNAKVSIFVPEADHTSSGHGFFANHKFGNLYGMVVDEAVDLKAATYISAVRQRFQLERYNLE